MNSVAMMKLAASATVLAAVTVGCGPAGLAVRPANASDAPAARHAEKQAVSDAARAQRLVANRRSREAVPFAEAAVAAAPRNAGYRMLLAQTYLAAGRLTSAETSFSDTLTLDPERERAALNLALVQTALGKRAEAMRTLADYRDKLPAADFGLAVALAGDPAAAVGILEAAARGPDASPKTRQNLALAYAMAGEWAKSRVTAQQDLDPTVADNRVLGWASFTSPANSWDQVASLLGVTPVEDAGQPTRLALSPSNAPLAVAAVTAALPTAALDSVAALEPAPPPIADASVFETAAVAPAVVPVPVSAASAPAQVFEMALAPVIRAPRVPIKAAARPATLRPRVASVERMTPSSIAGGRFVVQLGAFASTSNAQRAWGSASRRFGLGGFAPVSGSAQVRNVNVVRLAVAGFAKRAEADRMCERIRATRGTCFVRVQSGDMLASWVKRGQPVRLASR